MKIILLGKYHSSSEYREQYVFASARLAEKKSPFLGNISLFKSNCSVQEAFLLRRIDIYTPLCSPQGEKILLIEKTRISGFDVFFFFSHSESFSCFSSWIQTISNRMVKNVALVYLFDEWGEEKSESLFLSERTKEISLPIDISVLTLSYSCAYFSSSVVVIFTFDRQTACSRQCFFFFLSSFWHVWPLSDTVSSFLDLSRFTSVRERNHVDGDVGAPKISTVDAASVKLTCVNVIEDISRGTSWSRATMNRERN